MPFEFTAAEVKSFQMSYDEFERLMIDTGMDADMVEALVIWMGMADQPMLNMAEIMQRMGGLVFTQPDIQIID